VGAKPAIFRSASLVINLNDSSHANVSCQRWTFRLGIVIVFPACLLSYLLNRRLGLCSAGSHSFSFFGFGPIQLLVILPQPENTLPEAQHQLAEALRTIAWLGLSNHPCVLKSNMHAGLRRNVPRSHSFDSSRDCDLVKRKLGKCHKASSGWLTLSPRTQACWNRCQ